MPHPIQPPKTMLPQIRQHQIRLHQIQPHQVQPRQVQTRQQRPVLSRTVQVLDLRRDDTTRPSVLDTAGPRAKSQLGAGRYRDHAEAAGEGVVMAAAAVPMRIVGRRLPGSSWSGRHGIHVGVQRGSDVVGLVTGDAADAVFDIEVEIVPGTDGEPDFRGPYVNGRRGERYVYLSWGEVDDDGAFTMFRRLKLHLAPLVEQAGAEKLYAAKKVQAVLELTDTRGRPLAASVRPPWVTWRINSR